MRLRLIAEAVRTAWRARPRRRTMILFEHTAGQGRTLGYRFEHLAAILEHLDGSPRAGVCLDTCHLVASGYDIASEAGYAETFAAFERLVGRDRLRVFHGNDSKRPLGSRVDRHEHIGEGVLGLEPFRRLLHDPLLRRPADPHRDRENGRDLPSQRPGRGSAGRAQPCDIAATARTGAAVLYTVPMIRFALRTALGTLALVALTSAQSAGPRGGFGPGARVLLDAHNCYPDGGRHADRIDRALATGLPVAIEQDLVWWTDPKTATPRSLVSHGEPFTGQEPSLQDHFFERIRPLVESALRERSPCHVAAHRPQPRSQDQRAGTPRGDLGDARPNTTRG